MVEDLGENVAGCVKTSWFWFWKRQTRLLSSSSDHESQGDACGGGLRGKGGGGASGAGWKPGGKTRHTVTPKRKRGKKKASTPSSTPRAPPPDSFRGQTSTDWIWFICARIIWMLLRIFFWWPASVTPTLRMSLRSTETDDGLVSPQVLTARSRPGHARSCFHTSVQRGGGRSVRNADCAENNTSHREYLQLRIIGGRRWENSAMKLCLARFWGPTGTVIARLRQKKVSVIQSS